MLLPALGLCNCDSLSENKVPPNLCNGAIKVLLKKGLFVFWFKMAEKKDVCSFSPVRATKLQLAVVQPSPGEC